MMPVPSGAFFRRTFAEPYLPMKSCVMELAGGPARVVCELAGIKNIRTKSLGSNNKQNVVLATILGLSQLKSPEEVARNRGKSVEEVLA